ncbi:MAG: hypothetical protein ACM3QZ_08270 [Solirubrobacterales bacterium]
MTRGFWDGLLAGGVVGAAVAAAYLSNMERSSTQKNVTGKMDKTRQIVAEMGQEVAGVWRK